MTRYEWQGLNDKAWVARYEWQGVSDKVWVRRSALSRQLSSQLSRQFSSQLLAMTRYEGMNDKVWRYERQGMKEWRTKWRLAPSRHLSSLLSLGVCNPLIALKQHHPSSHYPLASFYWTDRLSSHARLEAFVIQTKLNYTMTRLLQIIGQILKVLNLAILALWRRTWPCLHSEDSEGPEHGQTSTLETYWPYLHFNDSEGAALGHISTSKHSYKQPPPPLSLKKHIHVPLSYTNRNYQIPT